MFGVVPKVLWQKKVPADQNNLCTWTTRLLLIEQDDNLILVDTGLGDKQNEKFFSHYYLSETVQLKEAIQEAGYHIDQVTDVILTHLHFDHCGGAIVRKNNHYQPLFKHARYWSDQNHWNWAIQPNAREKASFLKENILPIQESGQLNFFDQSQELIASSPFKNIELIRVNGHTESMILPLINYKNQKILYCADLLPSTAHISVPWVMGYDTRPLLTVEEKQTILPLAQKENWTLFFEHDAQHECCSLKKTEKGVALDQTFDLKEIL